MTNQTGNFWLASIVASHGNEDLLNPQICFGFFTCKFHFITTAVLSRQLIWGWWLYFIGSKTCLVSLYNSRCVKQTIAYKHASWWVLMLHYIYCFLFMASGSMTNFFPRNKMWKIFRFFLTEHSSYSGSWCASGILWKLKRISSSSHFG